jgi:hypothetical protein
MTHKELNQLDRGAATGTASANFIPEFCDSKNLNRYSGLSRSHAYRLECVGKIWSACIRRPGSTRGKRLWHLPSVLEYLRSQMGAAA